MTITTAPARNEYTANAGQTVFNYTFKIFENTDLNVYVTPAGQECSDSDLTTAYVVDPSTIGDPAGGFITLNTPTGLNDLVTIVSNIPSSRDTDYQNNGDFRPDTVNDDFDRVVSITKKIEDRVGRTLQFGECLQNSQDLSLPNPVSGQALRWNSNESGLENYDPTTADTQDVLKDQLTINYSSVTEMITDLDIVVNQRCRCKERASKVFEVINGTGSANGFNIIAHDSLDFSFVLIEESPQSLQAYGAIDLTDSTAAIQACIDNNGDLLVDGDYIFSSSLAVDRETIRISGTGTLRGANRSVAITYSDNVKNIFLKDFTLTECAGSQTINDSTSSIEKARVDNITIDDCEIGLHLLGAVKDGIFTRNKFNNLHRTLLDQSCQGIKIGNNQRATALETQQITIVDNHFVDIINDFNRETHAFIVYGREVVASNNVASGVTQAFNTACETYYFKADIVTCTGNTVLNQAEADDGCINFKGGPEGDLAQVTGQRITCTGNTIVNDDLSADIIGISCTDEKATITGNTLVNTWFRAFSGDDILFANNSVYMERSSGSITWFEVENANNVTIRGNMVRVIANNFDANTVQAARVRASADAIENFRMVDNDIEINYPDLTTGANTVSAVQIWGENFDVTNFDIKGNNVKINAPNINSDLDRQLIYLSGVNNLQGKVRQNEIGVDLIYFDDNSWTNRDVEFSENIVNNVLLTTSDKGFEQRASDVVIRMPSADANRTVFVPQARAGLNITLIADSPSFTMTMTVDATAPADSFVDGTTSKVLSVGATARLRCFNDDVWVIESQSGTIT